MAPAATTTRTDRVNLRVAPQDNVLFRRAAALLHESLSEFLVESARERAERLLADRTRFELETPAWEEFAAALDRPAEAKPAVVELVRRLKP
jgi:uncharacterized protein (DUF1778 family)